MKTLLIFALCCSAYSATIRDGDFDITVNTSVAVTGNTVLGDIESSISPVSPVLFPPGTPLGATRQAPHLTGKVWAATDGPVRVGTVTILMMRVNYGGTAVFTVEGLGDFQCTQLDSTHCAFAGTVPFIYGKPFEVTWDIMGGSATVGRPVPTGVSVKSAVTFDSPVHYVAEPPTRALLGGALLLVPLLRNWFLSRRPALS
jgi:hypothetical protein